MNKLSLDLSLGNFNSLLDLNRFFEKIRESFEREQKTLSLQRKLKKRIEEPISVIKFLFSSPDKV